MSFSPSSARECALVVVLAALVGCQPGDGSRDLERGKDAYAAQDLKKAEKLFAKSVERAPGDVDRILYLARVKLDLGEMAAAQDLVAKASSLDGDAADVKMLSAQIAWHAKDYKVASARFGELANDASLDPTVRAQAWAGLGVVEMSCDNPHLARVAFLRATRLDRRNAAAWYHLGLLYRDGFGYLEAALEQFEIFVRLDEAASPRVQKTQRTVIPELKDQIAHVAASRPGAASRASATCATAIAKAESAWKKGSFRESRKLYQEAVSADPLSYPAALGLARAWEKTDATKSGITKAYENYRLACALRPSAVSTFLTTGNLASRLGLHSQAVESYSRAVAASPTSIPALDGLIRAIRRVGNKSQVVQAYQRYRDSLPSRSR